MKYLENLNKLRFFVSNKIQLYTWLIPLSLSLSLIFLFYPGFMSYDTLHALRGARFGVTESLYPPMVSYIWRCVDFISKNPSAMHFFQVSLLITSVFYVVYFYSKKVNYSVVFLCFYLTIPVILGTLAVIWKDVLMAAFFMAAFISTLAMKHINNLKLLTLISLMSIFLIFLGICSRHNAIFASIPLIFYLSWIIITKLKKNIIISYVFSGLLGILILGVSFTLKTKVIDTYSLPDFHVIDNKTDDFLKIVRFMDIAGASVCENRNLFGNTAPNLTIDEIKNGYDARHINLSKELFDKIGFNENTKIDWANTFANYPLCFFDHRLEMTKHMLGFNLKKQYIITAPYIEDNEFGYVLRKSSTRNLVVSYIHNASRFPFFKPWFIYLVSIIGFIYLLNISRLQPSHFILYLSGWLYFIGQVLVGNAADARLLFFTNTVFLIFIFICYSEYKKRGLHESGYIGGRVRDSNL